MLRRIPVLAPLAVLVASGGYPGLAAVVLLGAAGAPVPVQLILMALGAASGEASGLNLALLALLGTAAAVGGDALDYGVGRLGGAVLPARLAPASGRWGRLTRGRAWTQARRLCDTRNWKGKHTPSLLLCVSRFVPVLTPLATPISVLLGASGYRLLPFLVWDLLGEMIYVSGNLALGWLFRDQLTSASPVSVLLWTGLSILGLAPALLPFIRQRQAHRRQSTPSSGQRGGEQPRGTADLLSHGVA